MLPPMIKNNLRILLAILPLTVLLLGCDLPFFGSQVPDADTVATAVQSTIIALQIQTIEANLQAEQQDQAQQQDQGQPEQAPTLTLTLTPIPESSSTPTPSVPMVKVSVDTNCRFGPGKDFEMLGALMVGEETEIIGRDPSSVYWYVKNPDQGGFCWLWGYYATTSGDISNLPVFTPMPTLTPSATPTAVIDFSVSFREDDTCSGKYYVEFRLENIGTAMFQSTWVSVTNNDDAETVDATYEKFEEWDVCTVNQSYADLDPGDVGFTRSADLTNDPNGKSFSATVKACTEPGLGGTCIDKILNFTP